MKPKKPKGSSVLSAEFNEGYKRFLAKRGLPAPRKWSKRRIITEEK